MRTDEEPTTTFSETEAQRILARAAELEASIGQRFSAADLQHIAAKAGIDALALEQAINESGGAPARPVEQNSPISMDAKRVAGFAGAGAVLGVLAVATDTFLVSGSGVAVFGPSALFTIYTALRHPLRKGLGGLLRDLALVFGSFTLGIVALEGSSGVAPAMAWSLACGILGTALLAMRAGARAISPVADGSPVETR